jgi:hypothetical protein
MTEKIRKVDLSDAVVDALKGMRRLRKEECLNKGENEIPDWIFCNGEGNPVDMHNLERRSPQIPVN